MDIMSTERCKVAKEVFWNSRDQLSTRVQLVQNTVHYDTFLRSVPAEQTYFFPLLKQNHWLHQSAVIFQPDDILNECIKTKQVEHPGPGSSCSSRFHYFIFPHPSFYSF
jgi:hypothetical protein